MVYAQADLGIKGDGSGDQSGAMNAAIVGLSARGGGVLYLEPGVYTLSSLRIAGSSLMIAGLGGREAVQLVLTGEQGIEIDQVRGSTIRDVTIVHSSVPQSGYSISMRRCYGLNIENVRIVSFRNGLRIGNNDDGEASVQNLVLRSIKMDGDHSSIHGRVVSIESCNGMSAYDCDFSGHKTSQGVVFNNKWLCDTYTWFNVLIKGCSYGLRTLGDGNVANFHAYSLRIDDTWDMAMHLDPAPGAYMYAWELHGLWLKSRNYTVVLDGGRGGTFKNVHLFGVTFDDGYQRGLLLQGQRSQFHDVTRDGASLRP